MSISQVFLKGQRESNINNDVIAYFCFPTLGVAVPLRPGDNFMFNALIPHCISSRCNMATSTEVYPDKIWSVLCTYHNYINPNTLMWYNGTPVLFCHDIDPTLADGHCEYAACHSPHFLQLASCWPSYGLSRPHPLWVYCISCISLYP